MSLYLGNDLISGNKPINLGVRNIGEIVASSLPLTDAGLHLLDGSLILGGGIYQGFVDYIADLYTDNPTANYFTDETTWQNSVTAYGVCGKFVYDSVNNTVRLPKVTGIIEGTVDVSALGDLVEAGLPNITGNTGLSVVQSVGGAASGALYPTGSYTNNGGAGNAYGASPFGFDASRSSSIYGNSSTVQPQTIKAFYYIVIANSTKTDIQVDIDEIATDLNGKADVDLTNTTDQGKILMSTMGMPNNTYINITAGASGSTYTAPADGYFIAISGVATGSGTVFSLYNVTNGFGAYTSMPQGYGAQRVYAPVLKGQPVILYYSSTPVDIFRFYYAVGSESEAQ